MVVTVLTLVRLLLTLHVGVGTKDSGGSHVSGGIGEREGVGVRGEYAGPRAAARGQGTDPYAHLDRVLSRHVDFVQVRLTKAWVGGIKKTRI